MHQACRGVMGMKPKSDAAKDLDSRVRVAPWPNTPPLPHGFEGAGLKTVDFFA